MPNPLSSLEHAKDLPLWAQVLLAARMAHRAALAAPPTVPAAQRAALVAGCEAIVRCARAGERLKAELNTIRLAVDVQPVADLHGATLSLQAAADAAHAAHDSTDFSAAETACVNSAGNAVRHASLAKGLNPLQASIFAAGDLDLLRFACEESRIGRYDALGDAVLGRLPPVNAPG